MTKEDAARDASYVLMRSADFARKVLEASGPAPRILILIAQVESDDGPVNVGLSWPDGMEADAAIVARETADVFDRQAGGEQ